LKLQKKSPFNTRERDRQTERQRYFKYVLAALDADILETFTTFPAILRKLNSIQLLTSDKFGLKQPTCRSRTWTFLKMGSS